MKGVCCQCQDIQEVRFAGSMGFDEDDPTELEEMKYRIVSHNFQNTNYYCEGSGGVPQALIKEEL